ncbi:MAG: hypothetical protein Q8O14_02695 [bacterium]|nr:hypothetical protein [bacterium]
MKTLLLLLLAGALAAPVRALPVPTTLADFALPGSQPGQSGTLENPSHCDNCHANYGEQAVEPFHNWRGGMMAQAMRDPLFLACLAVANQDAPQSGDLCLRCHTPKGWLEGRSIPTDGSALTANDRQGVQCAFCHQLVTPTALGVNPWPGEGHYLSGTYPRDQTYLGTLAQIPPASANGMYIVDSDRGKRGPYFDSVARHADYYSPLHKDSRLCGTCHDVSNPVFSLDPATGRYLPNAFGQAPPSADPRAQFPIERTFSEWQVSQYNTAEGVYAPQFGGNLSVVRSCQDCHMRDVTGHGCSMNNAPLRTDLPHHDMTGGNTVVPLWVAQHFPGEVSVAALNDGIQRARYMLQNAAGLSLEMDLDGPRPVARVRVTNETGHKLPSGYPEGRRIWLNIKGFDSGNQLVYESAAYDPATAILSHDAEAKVYEIKPGLSPFVAGLVQQPPGPSFHFVQNDTIYFDNRIPPRGFTNSAFQEIQSPPVGHTYADGQYWDDSFYELPLGAVRVEAALYYQTVSREYIDFLRDENVTNTAGQLAWNLWDTHGRSAPELMNSAATAFVLPSPEAASAPTPPDGATDQPLDALLAWASGARATRHLIHLGWEEPLPLVGSSEEAWWDPGPLAADRLYHWRIDEEGPGGLTPGPTWSFRTVAPLAAPAPLLIERLEDGRLRLSWPAVPQAQSYRIYRADALGPSLPPPLLVAEVTDTHWIDQDAVALIQRGFYLVRAARP